MKLLLTTAGAFLLLTVTAFSAFGVLATFEPTNNPGQFMAFRVGYSVICLGCIVGMVLLIAKAIRR